MTTNHFKDLPPSSPPSDDISDGSIEDMLPMPTSEDVPLAQLVKHHPLSEAHTSYSIPVHQFRTPSTHKHVLHDGYMQRSSSVPLDNVDLDGGEVSDRGIMTDTSLYSEQTEQRILAARSTAQRQVSRRVNQQKAEDEAKKLTETRRLAASFEEARHNDARKIHFDGILKTLQENGYTLAEFLEYVFNPGNKLAFDWRWNGFWKNEYIIRKIFSYWTSSAYSKTTRALLGDIALKITETTVHHESQEITDSKILNRAVKKVDEQFFLKYSLHELGRTLREKAPNAFRIFDAFASTLRQRQRGLTKKWAEKKESLITSAVFTLLKAASSNNSYPQAVHGTYLMSTGAQRQHLSIATTLGISISYPSIIYQAKHDSMKQGDVDICGEESSSNEDMDEDLPSPKGPKKHERAPGTLSQLSEACRQTARDVAQSGLFVTVYDNINMMFRVAEQILGRKNAQENGTCATIFPLFKANPQDLSRESYHQSFMSAPALTIDDILLTEEEEVMHVACTKHTILRIIVDHGGPQFDKWKMNVEQMQPKTADKIAPLKDSSGKPIPISTPVHPLPTMEIDESSIVGNIDVINAIDRELQLNQQSANYLKFVRIMGGDQLTIARQRSVLNIRAGHETGVNAWKHIVLMPGLFHAKIADCHGILETHFGFPNAGLRSPGSLSFHNTVMDRLPIVLSSLPTFRVVRDLIMVSLYGRVLHCLLLVSKKSSLEEYAQSVTAWSTVEMHAEMIYEQFATTDIVTQLRDQRAMEEQLQKQAARKKKSNDAGQPSEHVPKGDMVFENAVLFLRDALLTREFADAVKSGDSGRVVIVLKLWALAYRGSGRSKYAHEMLHVIYNIQHLWPPGLMKVILNNWLINPSGRENSFIEIDLLQEHLNFWIKKVYKADGHSHSWDWLAMVSPCVDVLRKLARQINGSLGSHQGAKHSAPDLKLDIERLMTSLKSHEVYIQKDGRILHANEKPATDILSSGLAMLTHGSSTTPLDEFNNYYEDLRRRWALKAVSELLENQGVESTGNEVISPGETSEPMPIADASEFASSAEDDAVSLTESEMSVDGVLDSPTLECLNEEDVDLDMDVVELDDDGELD